MKRTVARPDYSTVKAEPSGEHSHPSCTERADRQRVGAEMGRAGDAWDAYDDGFVEIGRI
jgi:hypothetical protein